MKIKPGVSGAMTEPMAYGAGRIEAIYMRFGFEFVVTSIRDGKHKDGSKHYTGNAADCRTKTVAEGKLPELFAEIKAELDPLGFDIVLEDTHIHAEYDPKPGENWLRMEA